MKTINLNPGEQDYAAEVHYMNRAEHIMAMECIEKIMLHMIRHRKAMKEAKVAERRLIVLKLMLKAHHACLERLGNQY